MAMIREESEGDDGDDQRGEENEGCDGDDRRGERATTNLWEFFTKLQLLGCFWKNYGRSALNLDPISKNKSQSILIAKIVLTILPKT